MSLLPRFYWTFRCDILINPDEVRYVIKTIEDLKGACIRAIQQRSGGRRGGTSVINCLRESPATVWNVYRPAFISSPGQIKAT